MFQGNSKCVSVGAVAAFLSYLIFNFFVRTPTNNETLASRQSGSSLKGSKIVVVDSLVPSDIPSCISHLVVEVTGSYQIDDIDPGNRHDSQSCRTFGFLLRDDLILSGGKCAEHAYSINIPGVGIRIPRDPSDVIPSPLSSLKWLQINSTDAELTMKREQPRSKIFFLEDGLPFDKNAAAVWNDVSLGMKCDGALPLLSMRNASTGDNLLTGIFSKSEDTLRDLVTKEADISVMAPMSSGKEKWWVRKGDYEDMVKNLKALGPKHIGPPGTISVVTGLGFKALLEVEDPESRTKTCLKLLYGQWKTHHSQKKEPFFDWIDYGSGKNNTEGREFINCGWRVKRFTDTELQQAEVDFEYIAKENTMRASYKSTGVNLPENTDLLYAWGLNRKIYSAKEHEEEDTLRIKHVSFFSGEPILMAGFMRIGMNGQVLSLNSDSGHYQPKVEHFNTIYHYFRGLGFPRDSTEWLKNTMYSDEEWSDMFL